MLEINRLENQVLALDEDKIQQKAEMIKLELQLKSMTTRTSELKQELAECRAREDANSQLVQQ